MFRFVERVGEHEAGEIGERLVEHEAEHVGERAGEEAARKQSEEAAQKSFFQRHKLKLGVAGMAVAATATGAYFNGDSGKVPKDPLGDVLNVMCETVSTVAGRTIPCWWTKFITPVFLASLTKTLIDDFGPKMNGVYSIAIGGSVGALYYAWKENKLSNS